MSDRLLPWIMGSFVLFGILILVATQVPSVDCGADTEVDDGPGAALLAVTIVAAVLAVAGALYRAVAMVLAKRYTERDGWILGAAVFVLVASAIFGAVDDSAGAGLALGGLILAGAAFAAMVVAALVGLSVDEVGALLPIYLVGAAWFYLCFGVFVLFVSSGIGC
jgi:hypothetical protein